MRLSSSVALIGFGSIHEGFTKRARLSPTEIPVNKYYSSLCVDLHVAPHQGGLKLRLLLHGSTRRPDAQRATVARQVYSEIDRN